MDLGRGFEPRPHQKLEGAWSNKWQKKEKDKWGITNPRKVASKSLNTIYLINLGLQFARAELNCRK